MDEIDITKEFLAESGEHLVAAEEVILSLETEGANIDSESINRLFRAVHTIKGGAGFLDFVKIKNLSHALENVAGALRDKKKIPDRPITDCLLQGVDKLKQLLADIENTSLTVDAEIRCCEEIMGGKTPLYTPPDLQLPSFGKTMLDLPAIDLSGAVKEHLNCYEFTLDLVADCRNNKRSVQTLLSEISSVGKILASSRPLAGVDQPPPDADGTFMCGFLVGSIIDDSEILTEGISITPVSIKLFKPVEIAALVASSPSTPPPEIKPVTEPPESTSTAKKGLAKAVADSTVRIPLALLDKLMNLASELVLVRNQSAQAVSNKNLQQLVTINQRLNVVTSDLQNSIMQTRMRPIGTILNRFTRVVRDLAHKLDKEISVEILGSDVELDKNIIDAIGDPMTHLVRNSIDHGIEMPSVRQAAGKNPVGKVIIGAFHQAGQVNIQIEDDGKGMDPVVLRKTAVKKGLLTEKQAEALSDRDAFNLIFEAGFSTAEKVTDISGRGVGMDVVRTSIKRLGGLIDIKSAVGAGTTITIKLPLTLAIIRTIIVELENRRYAIPQANIVEVVWLHGDQIFQSIKKVDNQEVYWLRGKMLPLVRLSQVLEVEPSFVNHDNSPPQADRRAEFADRRGTTADLPDSRRTGPKERRVSISNSLYIIVLNLGREWYGLIVDTLIDAEEIVVKPLHDPIKQCQVYAGMTVLGDGKIAMILDIASVAQRGGFNSGKTENVHAARKSDTDDRQTVLLFDIGGSERFAVPLCHITRVEEILCSRIQKASDREYLEFRKNTIPLVRIEQAYPRHKALYGTVSQFVIIPKTFRPIGIMAARILDTIDVSSTLDSTTITGNGIIGSQIISGALTLFLDIFSIVEAIEPGWFTDEQNNQNSKKRILLVDDSAFYRSLIASYLKGSGIDVVATDTATRALNILKTEKFDVVVSDIEMPVMNGFEFARQLRMQPEFKDIPLLAISAADEEVMRPQSITSGYNEFSSKFRLEGIFESIMKAFCKLKSGIV